MIKELNHSKQQNAYRAVIETGVFSTAYVTNFEKWVSFTAIDPTNECFNTTTGYYTVKHAGSYRITFSPIYGNITARSGFAIFKNDGLLIELFDVPNPQYSDLSAIKTISLVAGDTLLICRMANLGGTPDSSTIIIERIV